MSVKLIHDTSENRKRKQIYLQDDGVVKKCKVESTLWSTSGRGETPINRNVLHPTQEKQGKSLPGADNTPNIPRKFDSHENQNYIPFYGKRFFQMSKVIADRNTANENINLTSVGKLRHFVQCDSSIASLNECKNGESRTPSKNDRAASIALKGPEELFDPLPSNDSDAESGTGFSCSFSDNSEEACNSDDIVMPDFSCNSESLDDSQSIDKIVHGVLNGLDEAEVSNEKLNLVVCEKTERNIDTDLGCEHKSLQTCMVSEKEDCTSDDTCSNINSVSSFNKNDFNSAKSTVDSEGNNDLETKDSKKKTKECSNVSLVDDFSETFEDKNLNLPTKTDMESLAFSSDSQDVGVIASMDIMNTRDGKKDTAIECSLNAKRCLLDSNRRTSSRQNTRLKPTSMLSFFNPVKLNGSSRSSDCNRTSTVERRDDKQLATKKTYKKMGVMDVPCLDGLLAEESLGGIKSSYSGGRNKRGTTKKSPKVKENGKKLEQLYIDVGQRDFGHVSCATCGMVYTKAQEEDEIAHAKYHQRLMQKLKFKGWKTERILQMYDDGKIVLINPDDHKQHLRKVTEVREVVDWELGFTVVSSGFSSKDEKAFLFVANQRVVGCVIAVAIEKAYPIILTPDVPSPEKRQGVPTLSWCCSTKPVPALCGISRIWVIKHLRRQKIAQRLIDCVRNNFIFGCVIGKNKIAFSDPTPDGRAFAEKYVGTPNILVFR